MKAKELKDYTDEEIFAETRRRSLACKIWTKQDVIDELELEAEDDADEAYTPAEVNTIISCADFSKLEEVADDWDLFHTIIKEAR